MLQDCLSIIAYSIRNQLRIDFIAKIQGFCFWLIGLFGLSELRFFLLLFVRLNLNNLSATVMIINF